MLAVSPKPELRVWGTRGSFPAAGKQYMRYGGNTSCFSVEYGGCLFILDAGSGLAVLGEQLKKRADIRDIHIFLSHLHIDHVIGLYPFLAMAADRQTVQIHLDERSAEGGGLSRLIGRPYWPYSIGEAGIGLSPFGPGTALHIETDAGAVDVSTMSGTHPGGCCWYRLQFGDKSAAYLLDCETGDDIEGKLTDFVSGADLMVWDAHFAPGKVRKGWGHSTWEDGLRLRRKAGAGKVLMAHYSNDYDDAFLEAQEAEALAVSEGGCIFAQEGMVIGL